MDTARRRKGGHDSAPKPRVSKTGWQQTIARGKKKNVPKARGKKPPQVGCKARTRREMPRPKYMHALPTLVEAGLFTGGDSGWQC